MAYEASAAEIKLWKQEYGDVYHILVKDKACYLRKPDRLVLGAMELCKTGMHSSELILNQCWLGGDEDIKHNDEYFIGVASRLEEIINYERAEVKKL